MGSKHIGLFPDAEHTFWFIDPPHVVVGAGIQHIWLITEDGVTVDLSALHQQLRVIMKVQMYGVRKPTMSPSALHSGMSKKGECPHNAKVAMWHRLRLDVIYCAAYYAFCGKISPQ